VFYLENVNSEALFAAHLKTKNMNDNDKVNENISREMEDYNQMLHEKAEAFNKLAKALNDNYHRHLTETSPKDEGARDNQVKSKKK
jgi:uncharacterized protein YjgD (DUF1641 family)